MSEIVVNRDGIKVTYENDQMLVSSLEVSRNFQKEHKNVLQTINNLTAENSAAKNLFYESTYESRGKQYPMYLMNRDGFTLLAMGFTGKDALEWKLKYIQAFNEMEAKLNDPEFLVKRSMEYLEQRCNALLLENNELKPKARFAEAVSASEESILIGQLAKIIKQNGIDIGQNRLFQWMRDNDYLIKNGTRYNQPTQKAMGLGLFEVKERTVNNPDGSVRITFTTKVTGKGQVYFGSRQVTGQVGKEKKHMTEKEILERLKEVACIGDMSVSEFVKMKQDIGSPLDKEAIEDNYHAIKLGHILGKLDNLIADIYLAIERKETDKK